MLEFDYISKLRLCNLLYFTHLPTIVNVQNELRSAKRQIHKVHIFKVSFPFTIFLEFDQFSLFFSSFFCLICLLICGLVLLRTLAPQLRQLNCLEAEKQNILGMFFCSAISCLAQQVVTESVKGQLISKANFEVFIWIKKRTKIFLYFCL